MCKIKSGDKNGDSCNGTTYDNNNNGNVPLKTRSVPMNNCKILSTVFFYGTLSEYLYISQKDETTI